MAHRTRGPGRGLACRRAVIALVLIAGIPAAVRGGTGVWTSTGPDGGDVTAMAVDPVNSKTLYLGLAFAGVFKSTNGGASWTAVNTGFTEVRTRVQTLAVDP